MESPGVFAYICHQSLAGREMPRQWTCDGVLVQVKELPCSGKTDPEYLFSALESGARGVLVVSCPKGSCRLGQGNYRAEVRVRTVRRLLSEIGMDPERAVLAHCGPDDDLRVLVDGAVAGFCALGVSPLRAGTAATGG